MGDNVDFQRQRNKGGVGTKCRREVLFGRQKMERLSVKCVLFGNHLCFMHRRTALPQRLATFLLLTITNKGHHMILTLVPNSDKLYHVRIPFEMLS